MLLFGPGEEATEAHTICAIMPDGDHFTYQGFAFTELSEPDQYRNLILQLKTPDKAIQFYKQLEYHLGKDPLKRLGELSEVLCENKELPLAFILFGKTQDGEEPTAHIFHPQFISTEESLNRLQQGLMKSIAIDCQYM